MLLATAEQLFTNLLFEIYPGYLNKGETVIYEDDGTTTDYLDKKSSEIKCTYTKSNY